MFSVMSLSPQDSPHMTSIHDALDLIVQVPSPGLSPGHQTWDSMAAKPFSLYLRSGIGGDWNWDLSCHRWTLYWLYYAGSYLYKINQLTRHMISSEPWKSCLILSYLAELILRCAANCPRQLIWMCFCHQLIQRFFLQHLTPSQIPSNCCKFFLEKMKGIKNINSTAVIYQ